MRPFFKFFAERHILAILITLMIILLGINSYYGMKREMFPSVDFGWLIITARYPGASPEDVELNVTNKLEEELKEVTGIDRMTSFSMENISVINVIIDTDVSDEEKVKSDVRDAVSRVTNLPVEVTESPLVTELNTAIFPVIEVGVVGDLPYPELREIAKQFEKKLENSMGVSSIDEYGYLAREVKVEVDPDALRQYQISLQEIIAAIRLRNIRATAGSFESYTSEKNVVTLAQFRSPLEVGDVIIRSTFDGPSVKVKDLAIVRDDFESATVVSRMNGMKAITFLVNKKESADAIRMVDEIKELIAQEKANLPEGADIIYSNDFSRYVRNRFDVVRVNGLIGLALVLILLTVFLNIRIAFWVAMGIPVALLGTVFLLPLFGAYLDGITMAAMIMVIGIIVDDAIIIAENIQRHRERGEPPLEAAVEGIREVFTPVLTTILTTFLAFAPMFFMSGMMGKFIFVIPLVITLALLVSLVEATLALPAHLVMGVGHHKRGEGRVPWGEWFKYVRRPFRRSMRYLLRLRYGFVFLSFCVLMATLWYAKDNSTFVLFPSNTADQFYLLVELPRGSSLEATSDKVRELEELVTGLPEEELDSYATRIGTMGAFAAGENENWAMVAVNLTPFAERDRNADQIVESLREQSDLIGGFDEVLYYIEAGGPPVGRAVTMRIVASDDEMRRALADSVVAFLETFEGVKDLDRDDKFGKDQVEIKIDYEELSRLGLTVADVAQNVRIAYDGEVVTSVRYGDEDVDFRVLLQEKAREKPEYLRRLPIPNMQGRMIPLGEVASLVTGPGPSNYYHFGGERSVTVTADIIKGVTTPLEATSAVVEHFDLARDWPGARFVVGGEAEETAESLQSLLRAFMIAVVGIFFLLLLLFNSFTQPLLVMIAIPFGIVGVVIAFTLHGEPFGFVSMMGIVGLSGVVVNDSLVMVNHINRLRRNNPDKDLMDVVADGAADRLRAVILTTLTTVVGLMPLAYGFGGTDPYMAPMALALAYGLVFATPLTLGLVPCLYVIRADFGRLFRKIRGLFSRSG